MDLHTTSRVRLNNGVRIPWVGLGTYKMRPGKETRTAVGEALEVGYRHVDTASYYSNERDVGEAVADSGLDREQVFITTKVWNTDQGYERTRKALRRSLGELGMDRVDLYLIHWPVPSLFRQTWRALEDIYAEGEASAIGVSNFMIHHLEDLLADAEIIPAVNQVEFHPHLYNRDLLDYCTGRGIRLMAWSPIKRGGVFSIEELVRIGRKHTKTPAQVALRWALQHGVAVIPKSVHRQRMRENADIFDFQLSESEMDIIDHLGVEDRAGPDPDDMSRY